MLLAFCILSHGKPALTTRCVDNLRRVGASDIIVLDNGSSHDDFVLLSAGIDGKAKLQRSDVNLGITRGRIALADAADQAGARRIVFLDNDQFPNKHDCVMSMDQEIGKMRDPKLRVVSAHGSCLEFKQERRVLFTVSLAYPSLGR